MLLSNTQHGSETCEHGSIHMGCILRNVVYAALKSQAWLGTVAHADNPSTSGSRGRRIMRSKDRYHPGQHGETLSL